MQQLWDLLITEFHEHIECAIAVLVLFFLILAVHLSVYRLGPGFLAASRRRKSKALAKALAKRHRVLKPSGKS